MSKLKRKCSCCIKHSFAIASRCNRITLSNVCYNSLWKNSKNCHRKCRTDSQDQSLHGSWNKRHFSHKSSIEISSGKYRKCKQNHLFLSKLWCQFIYRNVKDQRQSCHSNKVHGCHSLRKLQKAGNKKGKSCLKHGKRDPIKNIRCYKFSKFSIFEGNSK